MWKTNYKYFGWICIAGNQSNQQLARQQSLISKKPSIKWTCKIWPVNKYPWHLRCHVNFLTVKFIFNGFFNPTDEMQISSTLSTEDLDIFQFLFVNYFIKLDGSMWKRINVTLKNGFLFLGGTYIFFNPSSPLTNS